MVSMCSVEVIEALDEGVGSSLTAPASRPRGVIPLRKVSISRLSWTGP